MPDGLPADDQALPALSVRSHVTVEAEVLGRAPGPGAQQPQLGR